MQWGTVRVPRDRPAAGCPTGVLISGFGSSAMPRVTGIRVNSLTGANSLATFARRGRL